jgi:hypothetical protein
MPRRHTTPRNVERALRSIAFTSLEDTAAPRSLKMEAISSMDRPSWW